MVNKTQYHLTLEQAEKAIKMCLDNAWSYLEDADMYISNNRTDHLAIPIEFAMEEIGKAKIIFDRMSKYNPKVILSYRSGIYNHETEMQKAILLIQSDIGDEMAEAMAKGLLWGDFGGFDHFNDPSKISDKIKEEMELKNTGKQGHVIRLASSFVDFDPVTNEPKIEKPSRDLAKLINNLYEIIRSYPSSFNTN